MPTNSPILPFLFLTMAGGCGVSNLMKLTENNSWVCEEMGWGGEGVKTQVSLSKPGPRRERAAVTAATSTKNRCQTKLKEEKETAAIFLTFHPPEHEPRLSSLPGWLKRARVSSRPGWAGIDSRAALSEAFSSFKRDLEAESRATTEPLLTVSPCFHPALALSIWLSGRIRTGLPNVSVCTQIVGSHTCRKSAGMLVYHMTLWVSIQYAVASQQSDEDTEEGGGAKKPPHAGTQ